MNPIDLYPLAVKFPEKLKSESGIEFNQISLENIKKGKIKPGDFQIKKETLKLQGEIAEASGMNQLAENFKRASELVDLNDDEIIKIYNALRPKRSTENQLLKIADELEKRYGAVKNAQFIRKAVEAYQIRGLLKQDT